MSNFGTLTFCTHCFSRSRSPRLIFILFALCGLCWLEKVPILLLVVENTLSTIYIIPKMHRKMGMGKVEEGGREEGVYFTV